MQPRSNNGRADQAATPTPAKAARSAAAPFAAFTEATALAAGTDGERLDGVRRGDEQGTVARTRPGRVALVSGVIAQAVRATAERLVAARAAEAAR